MKQHSRGAICIYGRGGAWREDLPCRSRDAADGAAYYQVWRFRDKGEIECPIQR